MQLNLYTVYDSKAQAYLPPFCSPNDATAIRTFETAVSQEDHDFGRHAEDYSLWSIAMFDQEKGHLDPKTLTCISQAHEIRAYLNAQPGAQ